MKNIRTIEDKAPTSLTEASINIITDRIKEASDSLYHTSKEKYDLKARLIEGADDMTTKEKLDALDQNYDRHTQEVWQGIIIFGTVSLALIGLAYRNPTVIKSIRQLDA